MFVEVTHNIQHVATLFLFPNKSLIENIKHSINMKFNEVL